MALASLPYGCDNLGLVGQARRRDDTIINSHCKVRWVSWFSSYDSSYQFQKRKQGKVNAVGVSHSSPEGDTWKLTQARCETEALIQKP